jgi:hypothetical protein
VRTIRLRGIGGAKEGSPVQKHSFGGANARVEWQSFIFNGQSSSGAFELSEEQIAKEGSTMREIAFAPVGDRWSCRAFILNGSSSSGAELLSRGQPAKEGSPVPRRPFMLVASYKTSGFPAYIPKIGFHSLPT